VFEDYAPVKVTEDENKVIYNFLQKTLETINKSDLIMFVGDSNASVGKNKFTKCLDKYGKNICNINRKG
jgi:hypothetical protein